jgi:hypothetical protein
MHGPQGPRNDHGARMARRPRGRAAKSGATRGRLRTGNTWVVVDLPGYEGLGRKARCGDVRSCMTPTRNLRAWRSPSVRPAVQGVGRQVLRADPRVRDGNRVTNLTDRLSPEDPWRSAKIVIAKTGREGLRWQHQRTLNQRRPGGKASSRARCSLRGGPHRVIPKGILKDQRPHEGKRLGGARTKQPTAARW